MQVVLRKLLQEYCNVDQDAVKTGETSECILTITQIRDRLYLLGNILYEDLDSQIYVASVRTGIANMNSAVVALQLHENNLRVVGYAKEGFIKQHISEKAIQKVLDAVQGKSITNPSKRFRGLHIILAMISLAIFVSGCGLTNETNPSEVKDSTQLLNTESGQMETTEANENSAFAEEVRQTVEATQVYNKAVEQFNLQVDKYNEAVSLICIDNIANMPNKLEMLSLESESYENNAAIIKGGNNKEKITADTESIYDMTTQVEAMVKIAQQINEPDGDWVSERLSGVEGVEGCQQITETLNPDGLLGKEGGYSACVYFSHSSINQDGVPGNSIVDKGTDAGGAVEIYSTLADAEVRVEYLAGFDQTILYSGSYAIVGTMVIRTSYKLSDEQQLMLTDAITRAITAVEDNG